MKEITEIQLQKKINITQELLFVALENLEESKDLSLVKMVHEQIGKLDLMLNFMGIFNGKWFEMTKPDVLKRIEELETRNAKSIEIGQKARIREAFQQGKEIAQKEYEQRKNK